MEEILRKITELEKEAESLEAESDREYDKPSGPQTATNRIRRINEEIQRLKERL